MATVQYMEFKREEFYNAILIELDKCMDKALLQTFGKHPYFGEDAINRFNNITGYEYEIHSTDFKAWLLEYGSGIYREDERNPYIEEYKHSLLYNPYRKTNAIARRGSDEYTQLDYANGNGTVTQTGTEPAGEELPEWMQKKFSTKADPFVDKLLKQTFILFKTDAYLAINRMNSRMNEFIVIKEVTV